MTTQTFFTTTAVIGIYLGTIEQASAYLDPGTGSILIQGLIGGIAAFLVVGKLYWFRLKSFLYTLIGKQAPDMPSEIEHLDSDGDAD